MLWDYKTTYKKLTGQKPFILTYGHEVVSPMEFFVLSLCITTMNDLTYSRVVEERLSQLLVLEEDQLITGFHQQVHKA
jgi:hypothetical protein